MSAVDTPPPGTRPRPPRPARRFGYLIGAAVNGALLWLANVAPGWEALPFLTPEFAVVLPLVNASILAGVIVNLIYVATDPPWLRAAGDLVTAAIGLAAMVALWRAFPFVFTGQSFAWEPVVRLVLGLGIFGSVIGIGAALVALFTRRGAAPAEGAHRSGRP